MKSTKNKKNPENIGILRFKEIAAGNKILPLYERLPSSTEYSGKGVTICIIDSGFYSHPDLTKPKNRILTVFDINKPASKRIFRTQHPDNWHGMLTSCVAAGNGFSSDGYYKSLAGNADVVLIKVKSLKRISGRSITAAIRWAIEHREQYNIRIINLSVYDDFDESYKINPVSKAAEDAVNAGIVVVAAVGNDPSAPVRPPASAPGVISVGGINDNNIPGFRRVEMYHSNFGHTVDGFIKPEVIAPAIAVPAPILPDTTNHKTALAVWDILSKPASEMNEALIAHIRAGNLPAPGYDITSTVKLKKYLYEQMARFQIIHPHYQLTEGTSMASPFVCSVIAQMIEADPEITPQEVKNILFETALKIPGVDKMKQGFGIVNPAEAVKRAVIEAVTKAAPVYDSNPVISTEENIITFTYHDHNAVNVALTGSFNGWNNEGLQLRKGRAGVWKAELPMLAEGSYEYKFIINGTRWVYDPANNHRTDDNHGSFNSVFEVKYPA